MAARRFRHGTNFAITAIALFVILVVVNVFSYHHFARWDLTKDREYTVSETTRDVLGGLDNIVNVTVYLSKDLPAALLTFEQQLRDLLDEYETYGKGNLRIEYKPPAEDANAQRELYFQGVRPQPVLVIKRDQRTQVQVYNSIVVQYKDQREIIPSLLDEGSRGQTGLISNFEYLLTSKIFKVRRGSRDTIGWLTNDPDINLNKHFRILRELMRKEWDSLDIRTDPLRQIPFTVSVLVVINPCEMTDAQLFEIDQYLMRGGKMLVLGETYKRQLRNEGLEALTRRPTNFSRLLERYGVKINNEIALEPQLFCALAPINRFPMPYEFWVKIMGDRMSKTNPAMARLGVLTLPWTQPLDPTSGSAGVQLAPLAWTSRLSLVRWGNQILPAPQAPTQEQSTKGTSYTVAAALTGTFPSSFAEGTSYPLDQGTTAPAAGRTPEKERRYISPETQIVVVGNSYFLQDEFLRMSQLLDPNNNVAFFQNMVEWLVLGKGLGQIRTRQTISRMLDAEILKVTAGGARNAYKILGTFAMPVLVVIGGFGYNFIRRRRRRAIADRILRG